MKNVTTPGILKISDIASRKIDATEAVNKPVTPVASAKADVQTKVATAKVHAAREVKEFREKTQAYIAFLKSTALFPLTGAVIEQMLMNQILEGTIEPVLANQRIMGVPQETFNNLRRDMFKALIAKYVDGK